MPQLTDPFRDFGILPRGTPPPPETVRSFLSPGRIIGQYIASGLVAAVGLGLATLLALTMPFPLNLLACGAALAGFGTFVHLATHNDYRWIELDGNTLRAKHLYTGRVIERPIADIEALATMVYQIQTTETAVIEALLGRVKGIEVRFRDRRTPLRVLRADPAMTNARELIEAIVFRMALIGELAAEVVDHAGRPIVRYIHWKGERPRPQPGKGLKVSLCCVILMGLMFGPILGMIGVLEHRRLVLSSVPAQVVPLQSLIENGPGTNPHVALTDFRFGGHVIETTNNVWSSVWIALIPTGKPGQPLPEQREEPNEIKAVVRSGAIKNEEALRQFLLQGQIIGICSDAPGLSGGTVRTELMKVNAGASLSAAWEIDDLSNPPTEAAVRGTLLGSTGCYVVVIALVIVILTRRS
jgi:hypothetical protein